MKMDEVEDLDISSSIFVIFISHYFRKGSMMKKSKILSFALALSITAILIGCNSDSSSDSSVGYYKDSALSGVEYSCGKYSGLTDDNGKFNFEAGKQCVFSLGGLTLRTVQPDQLVNGVTIVENNVTVASFLQTLDNDGNASNGIKIIPNVVEAIEDNKIKLDTNLTTVYNELKNIDGYNGKEINATVALEHLKTTEKSVAENLLKDKKFYVVFDDATGIFTISINDDVSKITTGVVGGTFSTDTNVTLDGNTIIWPDGRKSDMERYKDYIKMTNHYADGKLSYTYLFDKLDDAKAFAEKLVNSTSEKSSSSGYQVVAPADPSSLKLSQYDVVIFYKNTSYAKYNVFANDKYKYVSVLTKVTSCLDNNFTESQKVQEVTQNGVKTTTYYNQDNHKTCIDADYADADDANLTGIMRFVVYYNK